MVSLTVRDGSGFTYREAMLVVRRKVKLSKLDITELRFRKAITGALLFEIPGQDARSKASRLAERMAATLKDLSAKVTVPRRKDELRVTGLERGVTSWRELLVSLDSDPWGCPYKMVLNKLRPWAPPATESMDPRFLEEVVGTLFPEATGEGDSSPMRRSRSLDHRKKSHVTPRNVGARNRESLRKNCSRLLGGSERGKLRVSTESRPACARTTPGSWPRD